MTHAYAVGDRVRRSVEVRRGDGTHERLHLVGEVIEVREAGYLVRLDCWAGRPGYRGTVVPPYPLERVS